MADGDKKNSKSSPIVEAIGEAESETTGEIRVHISKSWVERDPFAHALRLFHRYGMTQTAQRNAVLLYVNPRKKKFAIIGDEGIHKAVGQKYWEELAELLTKDLHSTHMERAIAIAVRTIGATLKRFFPIEPGARNSNELSNEITESD